MRAPLTYHPAWYDWLAWPLVIFAFLASVGLVVTLRPRLVHPPLRSLALTASRWTAGGAFALAAGVFPRLLPWVPDARFINAWDASRSIFALAALDIAMSYWLRLRAQSIREFDARARDGPPVSPAEAFDTDDPVTTLEA